MATVEKLHYGSPDNGSPTWLKRLEQGCALVTMVALAAMVSIIVVDVVTRNLFGFSIQVSDEVGGYLLVAATFLAMPVSLANDGFHKVHLLEDRLDGRKRLLLQVVTETLSLAVCIVIEWQLVRFVLRSYRSGDMAMTDLGTPLWIPQTIMPIGFGLLCIVLASTIVARIASLRV